MISIIITSYKEPETIGRAIEAIAEQKLPDNEIIVVAPDMETLAEAGKLRQKYKNLRLIQDAGKGKSAALNLAVSKAKGDILVLTDGDVYVGNDSILSLLTPFTDGKIGAVSGNPVSLNSKDDKFGFWAHVLTKVADERRVYASEHNLRFFCSGYLFAIRKKLFPNLPEDLLAEDGYISHKVYKEGFEIAYSSESRVFVKYPDNFDDWIKQKKRSAGGYNQIKKIIGVEIRSFKKEYSGALSFFKYFKGLKELLWLFELFAARVYLWFIIYRDIDVKNQSHHKIWQRVESTK
jgi:cellulose synthase/poly-beta-1,6-N-acetylglucosamine synthase-like glycosyltransferase